MWVFQGEVILKCRKFIKQFPLIIWPDLAHLGRVERPAGDDWALCLLIFVLTISPSVLTTVLTTVLLQETGCGLLWSKVEMIHVNQGREGAGRGRPTWSMWSLCTGRRTGRGTLTWTSGCSCPWPLSSLRMIWRRTETGWLVHIVWRCTVRPWLGWHSIKPELIDRKKYFQYLQI